MKPGVPRFRFVHKLSARAAVVVPTIGLAARFEQFYPVVIGTTLGMMLANIPAVLIGDKIADKLPVKGIRITAAVVFAVLGALTLASIGR